MHVKGLLARSHPGRRGIPPGQKNTAFFYLVNSQPREHGNVVKSTILKGRFPREIHFNHQCHEDLAAWDRERADGQFVFADKWPPSPRDAHKGLMVRESSHGRYAMGVAWDSFLSAQGHNPWNCMHLSIKVGPLPQGQTKSIGGRIYLLEGRKEDCLQAFVKDGVG